MSSNPQHTTDDENDETWEILANASTQKASSGFSKSVMHKIEQSASHPQSSKIISFIRNPVWLTSAAACIAAIFFFNQTPQTQTDKENLVQQTVSTSITSESPVTIGSEILTEISAMIEDDQQVSNFLVTLAENPDILSEEDIYALMSF